MTTTLNLQKDRDLPPLLRGLREKARALRRHVVLYEGDDARVVSAAAFAQAEGLARVTLVGNPQVIAHVAREAGVTLGDVAVEDPTTSRHAGALADAWQQRRAAKGMTLEQARNQVTQPLLFAHLMVAAGLAEGAVGGAVNTTPDVVRTALQTIGPASDAPLVSSFFLMVLNQPHHPKQPAMIFTDCGLVIEPTEDELAQIALAGARSAQQLLGEAPRVAMLSFSTAGSAKHARVDKVRNATQKLRTLKPDLLVDGEVQLDAAIVPSIAERKVKESQVHGSANVLVFPNLDAGNIGYKLAERLGGATAIGPLLQGLAQPANDLSRGCSADDVVAAIVITSLQAA